MKRYFLIVILALILACGKKAPPLQGAMVTRIQGDVTLKKADGNPAMLRVEDLYTKAGLLLPGMTLTTAKGAQVDLQFSSGAKMRLGQCTQARLDSAYLVLNGEQKIALSLKSGSLLNKVERLNPQSSYIITTPTALAGVRGTEFMIEEGRGCDSAEGGSTIRVAQGSVQVESARGQTVLQTGEKASVSTDGTPAKAAMLETEKAEIQSAINSIEPASAAGQQLIETLLQSFPENDALHRQGPAANAKTVPNATPTTQKPDAPAAPPKLENSPVEQKPAMENKPEPEPAKPAGNTPADAPQAPPLM
jgi:hypothetical protein